MTIEIQDLSELDPDKVSQNLDEILARLQELNPTLAIVRGPYKDLVAGLHATLSTSEQETLERYLSARSLQQIEADPTLADEDVTNDVLSNYRVIRHAGEQAAGEVTIVMATNLTVTLASGTIFEADGQQFAADSVFTAKSEAAQITNDTDRLLQQQADGNWFFTIDVTAVDIGVDSILAKDTALIPLAPPPNFVRSFATNDFVDGRDLETNTELLQRFQEGIACKAPSNRTNMKAMLRDIEDQAYVGIIVSSLTGFGDEEQLRDQHTIWPGSLGGRVDWWIRTQERLLRTSLIKEASLIQIGTRAEIFADCAATDSNANEVVGVWQFAVGLDDAPGFYEIRSVKPTGSDNLSGTFVILADIRGTDLTAGGFLPDIVTVEEGAYSRYQTSVIQFVDDSKDYSGLVVGAVDEYDAEVAMMPTIAAIQDDMITRDIRSYGADVLVKAPVPVFTSLSFTIAKQNNQPDPDLDAIKSALAQEVNNISFIGRLYASQLHDIIHGFLGNTTSVGRVDMFGRIRYPDGTIDYVRSFEVLAIDGPAAQMVSPKTVQFYLDVEDISISIETSVPVAT